MREIILKNSADVNEKAPVRIKRSNIKVKDHINLEVIVISLFNFVFYFPRRSNGEIILVFCL